MKSSSGFIADTLSSSDPNDEEVEVMDEPIRFRRRTRRPRRVRLHHSPARRIRRTIQ